MDKETFYSEHWRKIEPERIQRYEAMFQWREENVRTLQSLALGVGNRVLDYGSGPGFLALGVADIVGTKGSVSGVDINAQFVEDANRRAASYDNVEFHLLRDVAIPLTDVSVDRVICKNVLEYVPSVERTLTELYRVLEPEGRILVIDSDWGFVLVEPWSMLETRRFFEAAGPAFREPNIGRKLSGLLKKAGFTDVKVEIKARADLTGGGLAVLRNMQSYGDTFGTLPKSESSKLLEVVEEAVATGEYLFCLPQFIVSAVRPK